MGTCGRRLRKVAEVDHGVGGSVVVGVGRRLEERRALMESRGTWR